MIDSISLASTATYGDARQSMVGLKTFNYLFGSNGSGKTTISRILAKPGDPEYDHCDVVWKGSASLETLVYNRDFVVANFGLEPIKGVFTLGTQSVEEAEALRLASAEITNQAAEILRLNATLKGPNGSGGKLADLEALDRWVQDKCWTQKVKHGVKLSGAFEGYRNDKAKFKKKVFEELAKTPSTTVLPPLADLELRAQTIFGETPVSEFLLLLPSSTPLISHESNPVLKKVVVGSKDVDIAAMIDKLGASDWVKQGRAFFLNNDGDCPFCQQAAPSSLGTDLEAYFDGAFVADTEAIEALALTYATDGKKFLDAIDEILRSKTPRLDSVNLKAQRDAAAAKIATNSLLLAEKRKEPSRSIVLEGLIQSATEINTTLSSVNAAITAHNRTVANIKKEKETLTDQVWRYIVTIELAADLKDYQAKKEGLDKAVQKIEGLISEALRAKSLKEQEVQTLEKSSTSVQPTVDEINALLKSYGFRSFSLVRANKSNTYALRRADEKDARETLSEGEKSFVTFLYFYHLLQGSPNDSGTISPRVAVFDDPVSSLDSDILFIVSSLIHRLMDQIRTKTHPVKQLFIFTHNVHFHREVTFNSERPADAVLREETFWIVRKPGGQSILELSPRNPVSSSYEMLWTEIRRKDLSIGTVQNTMRRILESYFKILGGIDPKSLDHHFEGPDKIVCKSLFSWINAGSHGFDDNLHFSVDSASVENHLRVFKSIFELSQHGAHYRMMMRLPLVEGPIDD